MDAGLVIAIVGAVFLAFIFMLPVIITSIPTSSHRRCQARDSDGDRCVHRKCEHPKLTNGLPIHKVRKYHPYGYRPDHMWVNAKWPDIDDLPTPPLRSAVATKRRR